MPRKRPFFLLEIVIAISLVGLFSTYFLRSSFGYLYGERKALLELEFERQFDLKRMELLTQVWNTVAHLPSKEGDVEEKTEKFEITMAGKKYVKVKKYKVWCPKHQDHIYDLVIKEDQKKYHFLVKKAEAKV